MIDSEGTRRCDAEISRRFNDGEYTCAAPAKWTAVMHWKGPRTLDYCNRHIQRAGDDRYTIGRLVRKERIE